MLFNYGDGADSWESLGLQGDPTSPSWRRSVLGVHWKNWCRSWNSNTLATWCEELTHLKRPWCWERLRAGGEGDDRGWEDWMVSPSQRRWVWVNSGSWWWTRRPGVLWTMGSQRVRLRQLNWSELNGLSLFSFDLHTFQVNINFSCSLYSSWPSRDLKMFWSENPSGLSKKSLIENSLKHNCYVL